MNKLQCPHIVMIECFTLFSNNVLKKEGSVSFFLTHYLNEMLPNIHSMLY